MTALNPPLNRRSTRPSRRRAATRIAVCALGLWAAAAPLSAQTVRSAPTRITSAFPAGSGPDAVARLLAARLGARWGQPVLVEPKPGAAGVLAINAMKRLSPSGNELVVVDVGNLAINPLVFRNLAYDPQTELVPVAVLYKAAFFVTVSSQSPLRSGRDLADAARGGRFSYGSNAVGGPIQLGSARLDAALGTRMLHVPFKETAALYSAVATQEVDWALGSLATTGPLVKAGRLRYLAVADKVRSPAQPDVPTLEEAGGPKGLEAQTWVALMAPAGTPAAVVDEINRAVNEVLAQPEARAAYAGFGFVASPGPASQVSELMRADGARYAEVIKRLKLTLD
ncbi:Bug family tripartite tricarboxylate transporter substrate binding protein [Pseudaquabacterium rugosum]|uniref:Tripartite tricarboxylate transporter substrate binding protein n=1 Tax=Pseudaquabacterium rugosum TaxID=2984194 RepID=A0ABU9B7G5_9BURK